MLGSSSISEYSLLLDTFAYASVSLMVSQSESLSIVCDVGIIILIYLNVGLWDREALSPEAPSFLRPLLYYGNYEKSSKIFEKIERTARPDPIERIRDQEPNIVICVTCVTYMTVVTQMTVYTLEILISRLSLVRRGKSTAIASPVRRCWSQPPQISSQCARIGGFITACQQTRHKFCRRPFPCYVPFH
jgi:hypothetical protein